MTTDIKQKVEIIIIIRTILLLIWPVLVIFPIELLYNYDNAGAITLICIFVNVMAVYMIINALGRGNMTLEDEVDEYIKKHSHNGGIKNG